MSGPVRSTGPGTLPAYPGRGDTVNLATREDVADRLPGGLDEDADVDALLGEASVMVQEYLRRDYVTGDTVPDAVTLVVSRMVARRVNADIGDTSGVPDGVSQLGASEYQASFAEPFVSIGAWMTRQDRDTLRRHRRSAVSFAVSSDRVPRQDPVGW